MLSFLILHIRDAPSRDPCFVVDPIMSPCSEGTILRSTEEAVRGCYYGPGL